MTEIDEIKQGIEDFKNGKTANFSNKQFIKWLASLITTIESQKEEIKLLREACIEFTHVHFRRPAPLYPTIYEPAYKMAVTALLPMQEGNSDEQT